MDFGEVKVWDEACLSYKPNEKWMKYYGMQGWGWGAQRNVPCETCGVVFQWHPYTGATPV